MMMNLPASEREAKWTPAPQSATPHDYLRLLRLDHMTKHVFIVPGIVLALTLTGQWHGALAVNIVVGFLSAVGVASANYVINEWLDRNFDRYHPEKSQRAAVQRPLKAEVVYALYAVMLALGLGLAALVNMTFLVTAALLALAGVLYNVRPVRSKDRVYLDVLSESINNPLRLVIGWAMVDATTLPPVSLILAFWFGGAFLMNSKRLAEYRDIVADGMIEQLKLYRHSFRTYTEPRLVLASLVYSLLSGFFLSTFLVKYRPEYILLLPLVTVLFAEYMRLAFIANSVARKPERLFTARRLMTYTAVTSLAFLVLSFVDVPFVEWVSEPHFIELR